MAASAVKGGDPKPPPAVNPTQLVAAQTQANEAAARLQQQLGMVSSSGPGGTVNYEKDAGSPSGYRQVTAFSPEQQSIYDLGARAQSGALGVANDQLGRVNTALGQNLSAPTLQSSIGPTDFTADREAITDSVFNRAKSRLDPMWQQGEDRLNTRLSNQGLGQNSTAAITAREGFGRDRNDAYEGALSSAILAGADEQNTLFNQKLAQGNFGNQTAQQNFSNQDYVRSKPIQDFATLLGLGGTASGPQPFSGATPGVAPADLMGAYGLSAQQAQNNYQAKLANQNSRNQGLAQLATAAMFASDRRVKKDMTRVSERPDGIGVWTYRYKTDTDDAPLRIGVMADEVERVIPGAVAEIDGVKHVDYGQL